MQLSAIWLAKCWLVSVLPTHAAASSVPGGVRGQASDGSNDLSSTGCTSRGNVPFFLRRQERRGSNGSNNCLPLSSIFSATRSGSTERSIVSGDTGERVGRAAEFDSPRVGSSQETQVSTHNQQSHVKSPHTMIPHYEPVTPGMLVRWIGFTTLHEGDVTSLHESDVKEKNPQENSYQNHVFSAKVRQKINFSLTLEIPKISF